MSRCEPPEQWREHRWHWLTVGPGRQLLRSWDNISWGEIGAAVRVSPESMFEAGVRWYAPGTPPKVPGSDMET